MLNNGLLLRIFPSALWLLLLAVVVPARSAHAAPVEGYTVLARLPHSTASYTEGFFYLDGVFYEGTGLEGHSEVMATRPETGKPVKSAALPAQFFGEGIVNWGPYLYEWTWKSHVCFVYDRSTFKLIKQLSYDGEGWGMTRTASRSSQATVPINSPFAIRRAFSRSTPSLCTMVRCSWTS